MGASTELGQSSSAMSASESRKPPPKTKQPYSHGSIRELSEQRLVKKCKKMIFYSELNIFLHLFSAPIVSELAQAKYANGSVQFQMKI